MKVCDKMDWDGLPLVNVEVSAMAKGDQSDLDGLNDFLIDTINRHFLWTENNGWLTYCRYH